MPTMHVLRGISGSGKTTERIGMKLPYVNKDEIRKNHPGWTEKQVRAHELSVVEQFIASGIDFVHDNTNIRLPTKAIQLAKDNNYEVVIKVISTPVYTCIVRDLARESRVGSDVIRRQAIDLGIYPIQEVFCGFHGPMEPTAYMFDLDGTIANIEHRRHFVKDSPKDWKSFFNEIPSDKVYSDIAHLMTILSYSCSTIIMTGRPETYRAATTEWLQKYAIPCDFLVMRPFDDMREDAIVKEALYKKYVNPYFKVISVFDDRTSVVKMWRNLGLRCYQVQEGDF